MKSYRILSIANKRVEKPDHRHFLRWYQSAYIHHGSWRHTYVRQEASGAKRSLNSGRPASYPLFALVNPSNFIDSCAAARALVAGLRSCPGSAWIPISDTRSALPDHFVERSHGICSMCIRQWKLFDDRLGKARRLSAMMHDGLGISHATVRHHFFDILHQTVILLLQASTRRL